MGTMTQQTQEQLQQLRKQPWVPQSHVPTSYVWGSLLYSDGLNLSTIDPRPPTVRGTLSSIQDSIRFGAIGDTKIPGLSARQGETWTEAEHLDMVGLKPYMLTVVQHEMSALGYGDLINNLTPNTISYRQLAALLVHYATVKVGAVHYDKVSKMLVATGVTDLFAPFLRLLGFHPAKESDPSTKRPWHADLSSVTGDMAPVAFLQLANGITHVPFWKVVMSGNSENVRRSHISFTPAIGKNALWRPNYQKSVVTISDFPATTKALIVPGLRSDVLEWWKDNPKVEPYNLSRWYTFTDEVRPPPCGPSWLVRQLMQTLPRRYAEIATRRAFMGFNGKILINGITDPDREDVRASAVREVASNIHKIIRELTTREEEKKGVLDVISLKAATMLCASYYMEAKGTFKDAGMGPQFDHIYEVGGLPPSDAVSAFAKSQIDSPHILGTVLQPAHTFLPPAGKRPPKPNLPRYRV